MKKINTLFFSLFTVMSVSFSACGPSAKTENRACSDVEQSTVLDVDALLSEAEQLVGESVTVEGVCTHICKHGGRKIFLMGSDDTKTIRIEGGEVGKFDAGCVNNIVKVTGKVCEQRIDEAYLQQWEARVAEQTDEKHGHPQTGCSTEKKARNETGNSVEERISDFRKRIEKRQATEGKAYLSFYHIEAEAYTILN